MEKFKVTTVEQIRYLLYADIKTGNRVAAMKLRKLYLSDHLKRFHDELSNQFIYYADKKPQQWEHRLCVAWVYIWFKSQLKPGESIIYWKTELNYKYLRPDALIGISGPQGKHYFYIEMDRHPRQHFEKVPKYNKRFEEQNKPNGFPTVLCVAENPKRVEYIKAKIAEENTYNLKFIVRQLSELQQEVKNYADNCINAGPGRNVSSPEPVSK